MAPPRNLALFRAVVAVMRETSNFGIERRRPVKKSLAVYVAAVAFVALAMFAPTTASAQVNIYVGPGGYAHYGYAYPHYGFYPHYGYSYGYRPYGYGYYGGPGYYGGYWGHGRRVARRVWRRHNRWGY
jgi:hypothetical protein